MERKKVREKKKISWNKKKKKWKKKKNRARRCNAYFEDHLL